ncbi:MAG: translation initiation factor [Saprospiraceae bacterium]|nr:translation initiation factor [Saprospiraceae bacterium]
MGKKKKFTVYSTNPDFEYQYEQDEQEAIDPSEQQLRVWHDRKKRKGKTATLVLGFKGPQDELEAIAKYLKTRCGVGGSAKDGEIIIQGEIKEKVKDLLVEKGYTQTKTAGG